MMWAVVALLIAIVYLLYQAIEAIDRLHALLSKASDRNVEALDGLWREIHDLPTQIDTVTRSNPHD